jgi:hypothetical protein
LQLLIEFKKHTFALSEIAESRIGELIYPDTRQQAYPHQTIQFI